MGPILTSFDQQFVGLDRLTRGLLEKLADHQLFQRPDGSAMSMTPFSCGEFLLRSAGAVEQTFDGLTTRLWDDPFEWTLPEKLSTRTAILQYLDEVEATRQRGFGFFTSDDDLCREIPAPEKMRTLAEILIDTLARASHLQGRAFVVYQALTGKKPPGLRHNS
ncbi:MAG: hypothetical protein JO314_06615 [Acidobacteria bacterium]|nr:hypothetical protein [Acidobacteriota bacterium]